MNAATDDLLTEMERPHDEGFFAQVVTDRAVPFAYDLQITNHENHIYTLRDTFRFGPVLTDFDLRLNGK